jgi:hypothetical protein
MAVSEGATRAAHPDKAITNTLPIASDSILTFWMIHFKTWQLNSEIFANG